VVGQNLSNGPIVLEALGVLERLAAQSDRGAELERLYGSAWRRMPVPEPSAFAWTTPWFIAGQRYAAILKKRGQRDVAATIEARLKAVDTSDSAARQGN